MLPDWGHNQHEIVGDVMINQPNTIFNVEEHRYTRSKWIGVFDKIYESLILIVVFTIRRRRRERSTTGTHDHRFYPVGARCDGFLGKVFWTSNPDAFHLERECSKSHVHIKPMGMACLDQRHRLLGVSRLQCNSNSFRAILNMLIPIFLTLSHRPKFTCWVTSLSGIRQLSPLQLIAVCSSSIFWGNVDSALISMKVNNFDDIRYFWGETKLYYWYYRGLEPIPHHWWGASPWLRLPFLALLFRRPHALPPSLLAGTSLQAPFECSSRWASVLSHQVS